MVNKRVIPVGPSPFDVLTDEEIALALEVEREIHAGGGSDADDQDDQNTHIGLGPVQGVNEVAVDPAGQPGFHGFFTTKRGSGKVQIAHV